MTEADADRILSPEYLADIASVDIAEVRRRLQEARASDDELSLVRRLIHGKMDILKAELDRRDREGQDAPGGAIVERLRDILGRGTVGSRGARPRQRPPDASGRAVQEVERILGDAQLGRLPELDSDAIAALVQRLVDEEQRVSVHRRKVLDVVDALEEELVRRFEADPTAATRPLGRGDT